MSNEKYYASGETLPGLIAAEWAERNGLSYGTGEAAQYEVQIVHVLLAGIEAGEIKKLIPPAMIPAANRDMPYHECEFDWDEVRAWVKSYMKEDWPAIPPWHAESAGGTAANSNDVVRGLTKKEITANDWPLLGRFTNKSLAAALSDVPVWLIDARVSQGAPGKASSTWNVALLAEALIGQGYANRLALTNHIKKYYPDWISEWESHQER